MTRTCRQVSASIDAGGEPFSNESIDARIVSMGTPRTAATRTGDHPVVVSTRFAFAELRAVSALAESERLD
jgi:hypothetical protein